jgi:hypothetical protein
MRRRIGAHFARAWKQPTRCYSPPRITIARSRPSKKNALDVGSRPYAQNSWRGKLGAIVSVAAAALGAFAANHHVRQCMVFLNVPLMPQPEVYIGGAAELFNAEGALTRDSTPEFLTNSCWPSAPAAPATASMLSGSA